MPVGGVWALRVHRCVSPGSACRWCWGELREKKDLGPDHGGGSCGSPWRLQELLWDVCPVQCVRCTWMASLDVSEGGHSLLSACAWLVLWKEGSWWASASLAGWGMPCPSGTALASQALLGLARGFCVPGCPPPTFLQILRGRGPSSLGPSLREGKIPETSPTPPPPHMPLASCPSQGEKGARTHSEAGQTEFMASLGEDAGCRFSAVLLGPRLGLG